MEGQENETENPMPELHCKHCKSKTENAEERIEKSGAIYFLKALCAVCGMKKAGRTKPPVEPKVTEETETASAQ
jgi:hypothetical protein